MDGYAIAGDDLPESSTKEYKIVDTSFAGTAAIKTCKRGEVIRIMTGGLIPEGTDTVIMQEDAERLDDGTVSISPNDRRPHKAGQNVRHAGEDITKDSVVLKTGYQINTADLGILASLGIGELLVYRRPRIAFSPMEMS